MSSKLSVPLLAKNCHLIKRFEQLYDNYFPRLYAYVSYRVTHPQDAEDLVAEVFYKVVKAMERFEWQGEREFCAWIFRITRNVISNFYRQQHRWEFPLSIDDLPELPAGTLLPEQVFLLSETRTHLWTLMKTLSPRQQEIIALKFFAGLPNCEIAAVLELDERTVAAYLCRGLKSLQQKYGSDCPDASDAWKIWMSICTERLDTEKGNSLSSVQSENAEFTELMTQLSNSVSPAPTQFRAQLKEHLMQDLAELDKRAKRLSHPSWGLVKLWRDVFN